MGTDQELNDIFDDHMPEEYKERVLQAKFYVTMKDTFLSGWGEARDMDSVYVVACDTKELKTVDKIIDKNIKI